MSNEMILQINNLKPIHKSNIEINKINVIGGENGSGKTTASSLLFCFLTAISPESDFITNNGIKNLFKNFIDYWTKNNSINFKESLNYDNSNSYTELNNLFENWEDYNVSSEFFNTFYLKVEKILKNNNLLNIDRCKEDFTKIKEVIEFNKSFTNRHVEVTNFLITTENSFPRLKSSNGANVSFNGNYEDNDFECSIEFKKDSFQTKVPKDYFNYSHINEVCYIDSPSILDFKLNGSEAPYHYSFLHKCLKESKKPKLFDEVYNKKIINIEKEISNLINGNFKFDSKSNKFLFESDGIELDMKNTASGYKQIGIIQLLLINRILSDGSYLIIDEPEVNLHPNFQFKLAKILVKLVKELNITLYLNSHSPQFIEAIEVFSEKYDLTEETNFYMTQKSQDSTEYDFKKILRKDLHLLYNNLGDAYDEIDNIKVENLKK